MQFTCYDKIPNSFKNVTVDYEKIEEWIATEKIHGCNFSFYTDGKDIECGRRNGMLNDKSSFYQFQLLKEKYEKNITNLFEIIKDKYPETNYIILYGELFGGIYPNIKTKTKGVQKEIYYSDKTEFIAFDISIISEITTYLSFDDMNKLCNQVGINVVPILAEGTFKDIIKTDIRINSLLPSIYDLPEIEKNIIEGIVVRPKFITDPELKLKIKNEDFKENIPKGKDKGKSKKKNILSFINKNRYDAVKSKYEDNIDKKELFKYFVDDALDDYNLELKNNQSDNKKAKEFKINDGLLKKIESMYDLFCQQDN